MKSIIILAFLLAPLAVFSQTQGEMNSEANETYLKADKQLNAVYSRILKEYRSDTAFIRRLRIAQRLWVQWRDAEMNAIFPAKDARLEYGSVFPMCYSMQLTQLTEERRKKLQVWLDGIEEGDVCSGSVRTR